jgi:dephospho-CoA kinase
MRPYRLGLTGSVGMGKSTTAAFFAEAGVPVWDADDAVHRLYGAGGAAVGAVADVAPGAVTGGRVDRDLLRAAVAADPGLLARLEARVHPLVAEDRARFEQRHAGAPILLFDIPLLFETGAEAWLDGVVVVTAPADVQRRRVLERPGMSGEVLERILVRQMPDAEKRARADFIIDTHLGIEAARAEVQALLGRLKEQIADA